MNLYPIYLIILSVLFVVGLIAYNEKKLAHYNYMTRRLEQPRPPNWTKYVIVNSDKQLAILFAGLVAASLFFGSLTIVSAGNVGVNVVLGKVSSKPLSEGVHFRLPLSKTVEVPSTVDTLTIEKASAGASDLQDVTVSLAVNYQVIADEAAQLYQMDTKLGYEKGYVLPITLECFKAVTSKYTAEELITKRAQVSSELQSALSAKLQKFHIRLIGVSMTDFKFTKQFVEAVEAKVKATQDAEKARRDLDRVKYEAEQKIVQAQAQAKAFEIQAGAMKARGGDTYLRYEAIRKWDGKLPLYTGGSNPPIVQMVR